MEHIGVGSVMGFSKNGMISAVLVEAFYFPMLNGNCLAPGFWSKVWGFKDCVG